MIPQPVVFFHIPKTAGMTVNWIFEKIFAGQPLYLTGRNGTTHVDDCLRFIQMPVDARMRYRYIAGHLEIPVLAAIPSSYFAFTFVRNPVDRLVSLYHYVKRSPWHHVHKWIVERDARLEDFLTSCPWDELYNGMTRRLAGIPGIPGNDSAILRRAYSNLEHYFKFIGLQESFDQSLAYLGAQLGIDRDFLAYERQNVNPKPVSAHEVNDEVKQAILRRNSLDFQVYSYCEILFKKRFSVSETFSCGLSKARQPRDIRTFSSSSKAVS